MKAQELMIGGFFLYKGNVVEIVSIDGGTETVWIDGKKVSALRKIDDLQPIPLTPEILEKNGFIIKKKWAQIGNFGNSPLIMWHFEDDPILHDFKHELEIHQNDTGKVHVKIPCEYVHELQHALRLCGIEKIIKL